MHALTLQLPLEGKLLRGGVTGVIKTAHGRWLHCQQHGAAPDFHHQHARGASAAEYCLSIICSASSNIDSGIWLEWMIHQMCQMLFANDTQLPPCRDL